MSGLTLLAEDGSVGAEFREGPIPTDVRHGSSDVVCYSLHIMRRAPRGSLLQRIVIGAVFCGEWPLVEVHQPPDLVRLEEHS